MATNRTFTMIKPDATGAGNTGKIIDRIIGAGFTIKAMKWTQLSMNDAAAFYAVHKDRPFFGELTEYMTSAPIVAASTTCWVLRTEATRTSVSNPYWS